MEEQEEAIGIQLFDLVKIFDSELLEDVFSELYRSNVTGKLYRLLDELNRDNRIIVRTPAGDSEKRQITERNH